MRFKVGDLVRIARVDDRYKPAKMYQEYLSMVGTVSIIERAAQGVCYLKLAKSQMWLDSELELAKEYFIKQVIDDL